MKRFVLAGVLLIFCFFLLPYNLSAQDLPCEGGDPYEECPIDSNIIALVTGGLAIGWFAIRKQVA